MEVKTSTRRWLGLATGDLNMMVRIAAVFVPRRVCAHKSSCWSLATLGSLHETSTAGLPTAKMREHAAVGMVAWSAGKCDVGTADGPGSLRLFASDGRRLALVVRVGMAIDASCALRKTYKYSATLSAHCNATPKPPRRREQGWTRSEGSGKGGESSQVPKHLMRRRSDAYVGFVTLHLCPRINFAVRLPPSS